MRRGRWVIGTRNRVRLISSGGGCGGHRSQVGGIRVFVGRGRATSSNGSLEKKQIA